MTDSEFNTPTGYECSWLVLVPSGNPEPDSPSDLYREVECGAPVFSRDGDEDHTCCENGHVRHAYGSAEQQAEERMEAFAEYEMGRVGERMVEARDRWGGLW